MTRDRHVSEITVKSVLNPVQGMPFRWSINPYRGCTHGCVFCLSGDTRILMADGTTKPLSALVAGDEIVGTIRRGQSRYYTRTAVLDSWSVEKLAFRVTLADGRELVASGDHRFLSDRGWKYVMEAPGPAAARAHLTVNTRLLGTGAFAPPPTKDAQYERGYLCGMIRGAGSLTRVAIPAQRVPVQPSQGTRGAAGAIRTSARRQIEAVERLIVWREEPSPQWCKGFLAGIVDAEGSWSGGILRISNTDAAVIDCVVRCLKRFGFGAAVAHRANGGATPIACVRLLGGLREHLRFFHTVDPAIPRNRRIHGKALTNAGSRVVSIEPLGVRHLVDITTGTGDFIANGIVSHNCYARRTHWFLDEDGVQEWSSKIFAKVNAPDVLRRELARPAWKREEVALGTATDPYQTIEHRYKLSRRILEALCDYRTPAGIVTRSPMITRDLDVLTELARRAGVTVCVSIATVDDRIAREIEPTVALPAHRLLTVQRLAAAGIRAGVILAPILPGITDDPAGLDAVVRTAREHGAHFVHHNVLHLGDVTRDAFFGFLEGRHPALVPRYLRMYAGKYAPATYRAGIGEVVAAAKQEHGIEGRRHLAPPPEPEQVPLFAT